MASSTLATVAGATLSGALRTLDTVPTETAAIAATSRMLTTTRVRRKGHSGSAETDQRPVPAGRADLRRPTRRRVQTRAAPPRGAANTEPLPLGRPPAGPRQEGLPEPVGG